MKHSITTRIIFPLIILISLPFVVKAGEAMVTAKITIDLNSSPGKTNRYVLGNSLIAYRDTEWGKQFNHYGGGIWEPKKGVPNEEYLAAVKKAGVSVLRWPGGKWRESMDWQKIMVGPSRQPFGLPEFLSYCELIGAKPVITLSAEFGEENNIAELVAYLNLSVGSGNKRLDRWARQREEDGRSTPWNVEWFEFGNENFNSAMSLDVYIDKYKRVHKAIKAVDPRVKLGAVLEDTDNVDSGWTYHVLKELGETMDFGVIHPYIPMVDKRAIETLGMNPLIKASLYADANFQYRLDRYQEKVKELGREQPLPLAATEYTAHFVQNEPVKVRHTLSTALHNADFVRVMLNPDNHIEFATYWHLANGYWGMLKGLPNKKQPIEKRPNYFVYKIYNEFLLDNLLQLNVVTKQKEIEGFVGIGPRLINDKSVVDNNADIKIPDEWSKRYFKYGAQTQQDGVLKVVFNGRKDVDYYHAYKTVDVEPNKLYRISVEVKTNGLDNGKAGIAVEDVRGWKGTYYQAKNTNLVGTRSWQWLTVEYRSLSDARKIRIVARKYKGHGKTEGIVEYGKVKIEKLPDVLPVGEVVTGLATISENNDKFSLILINKKLEKAERTILSIPDGYSFLSGKVLHGKSTIARLVSDQGSGDFAFDDVKAEIQIANGKLIIDLPEHSMIGLMFSKNQ